MDRKEFFKRMGLMVAGAMVLNLDSKANAMMALSEGEIPDIASEDKIKTKMPEMDAITAAKMITEEKIAPVLLLTAFSQSDMVKRATDAGVLAYLVKPVQESNLFPAMEVAISRYQEMQQLEDELFKVKDTLAMRKTLDRAKGILMDAHGLTESEAFRRIQQYSMAKRKTIKEVAEAIIRAATK